MSSNQSLKRGAPEMHPENAPVKRVKLDKIYRLMSLYKKLGAEIKKIDDREISFSDDYDDIEESRVLQRHRKLSQKRVAIYEYLAKRGVLVDEKNRLL
ncbi:unnamed protein product [Enterobius vermicularis]|uniref:DUF2630 family protein n=1 Tax=Enterobius vermicularis TaxID=51028 RepID=A0A0N4VHS2_ENTVE|nr:unnamed protein product [Enterobius vermicularis]